MQILDHVEISMEGGRWQESATLITKAQLLLDQGSATEKDQRRITQLSDRIRLESEKTAARDRGLEALEAGKVLT
jgi:hypothetical protein